MFARDHAQVYAGRSVVPGVHAFERVRYHALAQMAFCIAAAHALVYGAFKVAAGYVYVLAELHKDGDKPGILAYGQPC